MHASHPIELESVIPAWIWLGSHWIVKLAACAESSTSFCTVETRPTAVLAGPGILASSRAVWPLSLFAFSAALVGAGRSAPAAGRQLPVGTRLWD